MNMIKQLMLLSFCVLFVNGIALAQVTVKGKIISSEDKQPVPGAYIEINGTKEGTASDADGKFTIYVPSNDTMLVISAIGMKKKEVKAGEAQMVELTLDTKNLEEVIVTGYGSSDKKSFTGSAVVVNSDNIDEKAVTNVSTALAGEAAGVTVLTGSGQPGSSSSIRIRGFGSVNGNRAPLYVIDGIPLNGDLNSIDPSDIASTTILKDASATALYGSRGANGVIVITTKKGKAGKSNIEIDFNYGLNMLLLPTYDVLTSPETYTELAWEGLKKKGEINKEPDPAAYASATLFGGGDDGLQPEYNLWKADPDKLIDPNTGKFYPGIERKYTPERWRDELFNPARRIDTNVKISGGVDKTRYYTSFGYLDAEGFSINTRYQQFNARVNIDHQVKKWLKGSMRVTYSHANYDASGVEVNTTAADSRAESASNPFFYTSQTPPIYSIYLRDEDGNKIKDPLGLQDYQYDFGTTHKRPFSLGANPIATSLYDQTSNKINRFLGNAILETSKYKGFGALMRFGYEYATGYATGFRNPIYGFEVENGGSVSKIYTENLSYTWLQQINWEKTIDLHEINAFIGHENQYSFYNQFSGFKNSLASPFVAELNNAVASPLTFSSRSDVALESYLSQIKYNYDKKYFLDLTFRRDGSSRFKRNKWGNFYAAGVAWNMKKESFLSSYDWIGFLKLKTSYGIIGDQAGASRYSGDNIYTVENLNDKPSLVSPTNPANPDLTWEKSNMFQTGIEFEFFDNKLEGEVDFYIKNTTDLFFTKRLNPSSGSALITVNDGKLRNQGLEFNLIGHVIKNNDMKLDISINGEVLSNKITQMPIDNETGKPQIINNGFSEGHSLFDYYLREYTGLNNEGKSTWKQYYVDANNNGEKEENETSILSYTDFTERDENQDKLGQIKSRNTDDYANSTLKYTGKSSIPDIRGAFRVNAEYKGVGLSVQFLYQIGGYGYDNVYRLLMNNGNFGSSNWHVDIQNRWQKEGDEENTDVPRLSSSEDARTNANSDRFVTSNSYLSLNNVRLSYEFPVNLIKKFKVEKLSLWVSGNNLMMLSARNGYNPTISESGSSDTYTFNPVSVLTTGMRIKF